jgi:purine-binding chemotaxis protein CheW
MAVREIKGWSEITHLPKQPEYVRGVLISARRHCADHRSALPVRSGTDRGHGAAHRHHRADCVATVGLLADRVLDIVSFETAQISRCPGCQRDAHRLSVGLVTIESGMIALIDLPNLLTIADVEEAA